MTLRTLIESIDIEAIPEEFLVEELLCLNFKIINLETGKDIQQILVNEEEKTIGLK